MDVALIRNLALIAHNASGKTSLAEAMLFTAKATKRLGKVDDGSSVLDFEPEENRRRITTNLSFHPLSWKKCKAYLMDTPGDDNFLTETKIAASIADNAIFVADAVDPIKPQTEKMWNMIRENNLPCIMVVNKMDKERADFFKAVDSMKQTFDLRFVPLAMPIGSQENFKGVVDLIQMKAFLYPEVGSGKAKTEDIPDDLKEEAENLRNNLIEYAAESDDSLLEKFLEGGELSQDEIISGLSKGAKAGGFIPVSCASSLKNIGVDLVLNLMVQLLASPMERGDVMGVDPKTNEPVTRKPALDTSFSGLVVKTMIDPYAGRLSIFRVYSGTIRPDQGFYNARKGVEERFAQLFTLEGKAQTPMEEAGPGEIAAVAKLKETETGDTICDSSSMISYPFTAIPRPVLTYALKPKSRADEEKISQALIRLKEEDPALFIDRDKETAELLLSGVGQIHVENTIEKMERKYGVHVDLTLPKIPYRETIKGAKKGIIYRHKKQTGGAGQFAEVHFDISPLERGRGFEFEEALVGMNVPRNFVPAVEKGLHEAMASGPLAGYPVVDVKVRFYDGKSHEVDSSEMAFKIASIQCFKKGVLEAKPALLEPIVKLTIDVPDDVVGDIIGDLNSRRGRIMGMEPGKGVQTIIAMAPIAEVQRYVLDLNAMTAGRGTFSMEQSHYEEVPSNIAEKIIEKAKEEKG